ncbi:MAG: hypothetical protein ACXWT4_05195 [Methylobacter sp.]
MEKYRLRIREFLRQPTAQSSVLLVIGKRGAGKTRLVDESLNERQPYTELLHKLLPWLDGRNRNSRSLEMRQPRNVNRYLLKVDVDPFFPTEESKPKNSAIATHSASDNSNATLTESSQDRREMKEKKQMDGRLNATGDAEVAFYLLSNIVFSITSMIDARPNISAHGRTLRAILGFWRYWFAPNALLLPSMSNWWVVGGLGAGYWLFKCWINFVSGLVNAPQYVAGFGYVNVSFVAAFICAYLLLRWRDLRAVIKMGGKLYELAHAQETLRTDEKKYSTNAKWAHKWALPTGVILAAVAFMLNQSDFKIPHVSITKELAAALFGASALSLIVSFARNKEAKASYGSKNPQWMITLLRRYLYLLHRCGLEPVLVFDELDKLESPHNSDHNFHPDKLSLFLSGILRIRNTIGTNFKIILIGGESVGDRLYEERRNPKSLGPIATLVHQEIVLGPLSLASAKDYLNSCAYSPEFVWLRTYGVFALMAYELNLAPAAGSGANDAYGTINNSIAMAKLVNEVWEEAVYKQYIVGPSECPIINTNQEWIELWLHTGMLELASALIFGGLDKHIISVDYIERLWQKELADYFDKNNLTYDPGVYDQRTEKPETALQVGTSVVLKALGKFILFRHLQREGKIQTGANGAVKFKP